MAKAWLGDNVLVADRIGLPLLEIDSRGFLVDTQGRVSSNDEGAPQRSIERLAHQVAAWLKWAAPHGANIHPEIRPHVEALRRSENSARS